MTRAANITRECRICGKVFKTIPYMVKKGYAKFCSSVCYGKSMVGIKQSKDYVRKRMEKLWVMPRSATWCKNIAKSKLQDKSHFWKGGITERSRIIRGSTDYRQWRDGVLKRDGYKCVLCGSGSKIQADHILAFSDYPEKRFDLDNGRVLCEPCHKKTPNYGNQYARRKRAVVK